MSHFVVIVIGNNIDAQLAPYDENTRVAPYREDVSLDDITTAIRWWIDKGRLEAKKSNKLERNVAFDVKELVVVGQLIERPSQMAVRDIYQRYTEDELFHDDRGYYRHSTYNPRSKWDWWEIGGRWRGFFTLVANPRYENRHGDKHFMEQDKFGGRAKNMTGLADQLRRADLDVERWRAVDPADGEKFDAYAVKAAAFGQAVGWSKFIARVKANELTIEQARELYSAQPIIKEINDFDCPVDHYGEDRATYMQRCATRRSTPYAYIANGEWFARGEMGWWGIDHKDGVDQDQFEVRFANLVDELPSETLLSAVDCHI